jgi:hypothetical protein
VLTWTLVAGLVCHLAMGLMGCGVKAPPVPARMPLVPAVVDLEGTLDGLTARLAWGIAEPLPRARAENAAFGIFRSRSTLDQAACQGCPLVFESMMTVLYVDPDDGRFSTIVPLEPGYRYTFKVRLEIGRVIGPGSNLVTIETGSSDPADRVNQP